MLENLRIFCSPQSQSPAPDERRKAKLATFLADMLRVGCVKGFKYFQLYMRGREELIIIIKNEPMAATPTVSPANSMSGSKELPRNQQSLMLSARTQRRLKIQQPTTSSCCFNF
eukprot:m.110222 g.110222  ORF g.110222 m.110222 type:complete len:114 (+) comp19182_c0_seq2:121-462(+)